VRLTVLFVVDPESDIAIATMAQLLLQEGRPQEALEYFDKSVDLGRTEQELLSAISYAEVVSTNQLPLFTSGKVLTVHRLLELNLTSRQNILMSPRNYQEYPRQLNKVSSARRRCQPKFIQNPSQFTGKVSQSPSVIICCRKRNKTTKLAYQKSQLEHITYFRSQIFVYFSKH
jgi:hypothetical protein